MPPDPSSSAKQKEPKSKAPQSASEAVLQECSALEEEIAALRAAYEQYFLGIERHPPLRDHEELKKRLHRLIASSTRNTAVKFRVQSINNKFLTHDRLWSRTLQEIENGTYRRDVFKAKRRAGKSAPAGERQQKGAHELTEDLSNTDLEDLEAVARQAAESLSTKPAVPAVAAVAAVVPPLAPLVPPLAPAIAPVVPPVAPAAPGSVSFRGTPAVPPAGIPGVAPVVPPIAPVAGAPPFRGAPTVAPVVPPVAPAGGTPPKGLPTLTPPVPPVSAVPPPPPGMAPARTTTSSQVRITAPGAVPPPPPAAALQPPPPPGAARPPPPPGSAARPPPPPGSAPARPPAAPSSSALSDEKLRTVYDAYVQAKRRCQEDTSKMSFEQVATTLRKQVPELLKQSNASAVEFKVVIKDGKAVLKAVPK